MPETTIAHDFAGLPLWEHFLVQTQNLPAEKKMVMEHVADALPLLDRFVVAFPKYTLHNRRHQQNIIKLMGDLLDEKLSELTGLESAMLILSAVYHDIGMVFSTADLAKVTLEPDFKIFLQENARANLQFEENGKVAGQPLIEWYCRWMHAKRVWIYLDSADIKTPFMWKSMPFKMELGNVCQSHNESVDYIKHHEAEFSTNFLGECDLVFCAIMLRLADIMDFDNSRTPKSVYEFLELDKAQTGSDLISDEEWQKHLSSGGFKFDRVAGKRVVLFLAAPSHPKVEISIRNFLKVIEAELYACSLLLKYCSARWQSLELPGEINKENIKGRNYKSGSYQFSLSEDNVMTLLTGEGLYNDRYIFLRELLQNAMDTSRHREFREKTQNTGFQVDPIEVSFFTDTDGYQWLRIDDFGMGMNEEIIERHLLKKGESYYNSDKFKLEKLHIQQNAHTEFVPISRFGIGLLSCFIIGDRIEISTVHKDEPDNAYRLSVENRNGFFMMQTKKERHQPLPMPAQYPGDTGFREKIGTSIAVRINTNKEFAGFNVKERLEYYLLAPPVSVKFNGARIGGDFNELLNTPWAEETTYPLSGEFVEATTKMTGIDFPEGIKVNLFPVSLTANSLSPKLIGQMLVIAINVKANWPAPPADQANFRVDMEEGKVMIHCVRTIKEGTTQREERTSEDISGIMASVKVPGKLTRSNVIGDERYHFGGIRLSHNGIQMIDDSNKFELDRDLLNQFRPYHGGYNNWSFHYTGIFYFQDELLPDLTVSRNEIKGLSFGIVAHLLIALCDLNRLILFDKVWRKFDFFKDIDRNVDCTTGAIKKSGFYEDNKAFWDKEITLWVDGNETSIADLLPKITSKMEFYKPRYSSLVYNNFVEYLIEQNFNVSVEFTKVKNENKLLFFLSPKTSANPEGYDGFDPFTFLSFENGGQIITDNNMVNTNHPYVKWFFSVYPLLNREYFYYSKQLIYSLFGSYMSSSPEVEKINNILEKLRQTLLPEQRPSTDINLTREQFVT